VVVDSGAIGVVTLISPELAPSGTVALIADELETVNAAGLAPNAT
jgi:hypothetical protein